MKSTNPARFIFALLTSVAAWQFTALAGPLTPPAGPVAPTPGPQARTPVNAITCPGDNDATPCTFKITQPGSYYLQGHLDGEAGKHGIEIASPFVTLDLNGFTIRGVPTSKTGVLISAISSNAEIRNGKVMSWGGDGIDYEGSANNVRILNIQANYNTGSGINVGAYSMVRECEAYANGVDGIRIYSVGRAESCTANSNGVFGINIGNSSNVVSRCVASNNGDDGFNASAANTFVDCIATYNTGDGFRVSKSVLRGCQAVNNSGYGFYVDVASHVSDCNASGNTLGGFDAREGSFLINNNAHSNATTNTALFGFTIAGNGVRAVNNHASGNGSGFTITGGNCVVTGNTASGNIATGFRMNTNANCVFTGNIATGNVTNYTINTGNDSGAILTNPGVGFSTTNPAVNIAN